MFKNIRIVHPPQPGPNILHGNFEPCITVKWSCAWLEYVRGGSSAHYRTEEGDFAFRAVKEVPRV